MHRVADLIATIAPLFSGRNGQPSEARVDNVLAAARSKGYTVVMDEGDGYYANYRAFKVIDGPFKMRYSYYFGHGSYATIAQGAKGNTRMMLIRGPRSPLRLTIEYEMWHERMKREDFLYIRHVLRKALGSPRFNSIYVHERNKPSRLVRDVIGRV